MKLNAKTILEKKEINNIKNNINTIMRELYEIKNDLIEQIIIEGVDDPGILKCVFMAGGPGCFVAGTKVKTETGYENIEDIKPNTLVYTINEITGDIELKPVILTHIFETHEEDLLELEFEDGVIIRCTENHKFYVDGNWISARDLVVIRKTNLGKCNVPVYDLTVLDNSNYQITENDIIVHNSGKSYTAADIFGVDKKFKTSFAASGLKVVNSDSAFEKMLKDNGINPKELGNIERDDPELWDKITGKDSIRTRAKDLSNKQKAFYEEGRLGMIVDGTGDDYEKIKKQKQHAESLGYDCYMVFVNTTLEVALERNRKRERTLPDSLVQEIWKDVQSNLGKFQGVFGDNFSIVDNTTYGPSPVLVVKAINQFLRKPIYNHIGKKWIETARALKRSKLIK